MFFHLHVNYVAAITDNTTVTYFWTVYYFMLSLISKFFIFIHYIFSFFWFMCAFAEVVSLYFILFHLFWFCLCFWFRCVLVRIFCWVYSSVYLYFKQFILKLLILCSCHIFYFFLIPPFVCLFFVIKKSSKKCTYS